MPRVEIGAAIGSSFAFIGRAWARAWGIMLVAVWLAAALAAIQALRPEWTFAPLLGLVLKFLVGVAVVGALYRVGIESRHPGDPEFRAHAAGFQWGGLEWRVLGANLLIALIVFGVAVVFGIIWAILFGVTAASDQADLQGLSSGDNSARMQALVHILLGPAGVISLAIMIPALVASLYFGARLSLYTLVAADARSFGFDQTWRLTRGAIWAIILTWIVTFIAQMALGMLIGLMLGMIGAALGQTLAAAAWISVIAQGVGAAIAPPLSAGLLLYVYNTRRGGEDVAAAFT